MVHYVMRWLSLVTTVRRCGNILVRFAVASNGRGAFGLSTGIISVPPLCTFGLCRRSDSSGGLLAPR